VATAHPNGGEVTLLDAKEGEAIKCAAGTELQDGDETLEAVRTNGNDASETTVFSCAGSARREWLNRRQWQQVVKSFISQMPI
jgi:hypothetical protein